MKMDLSLEHKINNYRSSEINQIAGALAKAQGAYKKLVPNQRYKNEKYANLEAILFATREALSINGIAFSQHDELLDDGLGAILLKTTLMHESGQWISSWARIVSCKTFKETGAVYEFTARLQAVRLLGIAASENDPYLFDDNGEMQAEQVLLDDIKKPREMRLQEKDYKEKTINNFQYNELMIELDGYERIAISIMKKHGIDTLADLPESMYHSTMGEIRRIKKLEETTNESRRK